ncbi:MAG: Muramidase (flagellum-specific) [Bacteroidetes bacterium]|jgi:LysM repeat protein|nr:Muramidase (flagellum-specific) [Bacteroidota bacterium]
MANEMYQKTYISIILFTLLSAFAVTSAQAQRKNQRYTEYIDRYNSLAVEQMKIHKIPASITLAQGLLESGAGYSELARKSNNHFGIKCGNWRGPTVRHDDDARQECFRAYDDPVDSYEDHSLFLRKGARYAFLFRLDITDYKAWARGLKQAGYATDPSYANRLITIIEDYELYKYDTERHHGRSAHKKEEYITFNSHQVYLANDLAYVIARRGDTFESLSKEFDISSRKLVKYNDLQKDYTITDGDIIYLHAKNKKAAKAYVVHVVRDGDSMHTISQKYGIRLKNLYKMNRKEPDYVPEVGDRLRLR